MQTIKDFTQPAAGLPEIHFSQNWNGGKLNLKCFSTIRLYHAGKYREGQLYKIMHQGNYCFDARIVSINVFRLESLSDAVARLDCGMDRTATIQLLHDLYKDKVTDFKTADFCLIILDNEKSQNWRQPTKEEMAWNA